MKRFYAVVFTLFTFAGVAYAKGPQLAFANGFDHKNGNGTPAPKTPNAREWQKEEDHINGHIRANKLAAMKNTAEGIISVFHDSILTQDVNPVWHGEYFPAVNGGPQVHFGVRCVFNDDDNTATDNDLTTFANDITPLLGNLTVNGNNYTTVKTAKTVKGNQLFEFDTENNLHVKAWLVVADGAAMPYIPVTRKEYLEQAHKELISLREAVDAQVRAKIPVRSAAVQEAEKAQMLRQLRDSYSGAELETRTRVYLRNYIKDEDLVAQTIARSIAGYNGTLALVDNLLHTSSAQMLAQPAVVSVTADNFVGFEDGKANTTTLVRLNPAYFAGSAEQAPKCLLICWRYNPADAHSTGIDSQLDANFAAGSFQNLLAQ
jgi:hypothetical protein